VCITGKVVFARWVRTIAKMISTILGTTAIYPDRVMICKGRSSNAGLKANILEQSLSKFHFERIAGNPHNINSAQL